MAATEYNKEKEYDTRIKEYVKTILLICEQEKIPVFMSFAVANENNETTYVNEMVSAGFENVVLYDDHIARHALVVNGFDVTPRVIRPVIEEEREVE